MMHPLGLALLTLTLGLRSPPQIGSAPQPSRASANALVGRWRGQEEDALVDLEFKADHTLLIRHGSNQVFKAFRYAVNGNVLTLHGADKAVSRQQFQLTGPTLTLRPVRPPHSASIDLLYYLPFHRVL
jgi:hypothetical protein